MRTVTGAVWREGPLMEALDRGEWEWVVTSLAWALLRLWEGLPADAALELLDLLGSEGHG